MVVTAVQFWQRIESSGLANPETVRQMAATMAGDLPADRMTDTLSVAKWLIEKNHLTKYQARVLLDEVTGPLRCGGYLVRQPLRDQSLPNWYLANPDGGTDEFWLLAISEQELGQPAMQTNPPGISLARQHAKIRDELLCALTDAQISDSFLCVASSVPIGNSLQSTIAGSVVPYSTAKAIIIQTAMAIDRLHSVNMVHGDLGMHCIYWDGEQQVTLLRDPLFLPANPLLDPNRIGALQAEPSRRLAYAAPEFTTPGQQPTTQSDLYALGCLWFELLTGRTYVRSTSDAQLVNAVLKAKCETIQVSGWNHRLQRVLLHLLAKNPTSRFQTVRQFLHALQVAEPKQVGNTPPAAPPEIPASAAMVKSQPPANTKVIESATKASPKATTISSKTAKEPNVKAVTDVAAPASPAKSPAPASAVASQTKVTDSTKPSPPAAQSGPWKTSKKSVVAATTTEPKPPASEDVPVAQPISKPKRAVAASTPKPIESSLPTPPVVKPNKATSPPINPDQPIVTAPKVDTGPTAASAIAQIDAPETKLLETNPLAAGSAPIKQTAAKPEKPPNQTKPTIDLGATTSRRSVASSVNRRKQKPVWVMPAMATIAVGVLAAVAFLLMPRQPFQPSPKQSDLSSNPVPTEKVVTPIIPERIDPVAEQFNVVADDGETLWAPPHVPDPISLQMLPPGLQGLLHCNMERIRKQERYTELNELLQTSYQSLVNLLEQLNPFGLDQTKMLTVAIYPNDASEWPDLVVRSDSTKPQPVDQVMAKFGFATPPVVASFGNLSVVQNSDSKLGAVAIITDVENQLTQSIVVGKPDLIRQMIEMEGGIAPLTRQLETLRQRTSLQNDLTYMSTTSLLLSSGRGMLANSLPALLPYLRLKMREDVAALSLTTNIDDAWYGELRIAGKDEQIAPQLQNELRSVFESLPSDAESQLIAQPADAYWAKLAIRLPQQLRSWKTYLRTGIEEGANVANFYLPKTGATNLTLASWMSLRQPARNNSSVAVATPSSNVTALTIDQVLDLPLDIAFDQESLESSAKAIIAEFNSSQKNPAFSVSIEINGGALEKDGITRNQQIRDFKHSGSKLRDVLLDLVRKGNPVTTVQKPTETDQKLVWVIKDADKRVIEITTRTAATTTKQTLPAIFTTD